MAKQVIKYGSQSLMLVIIMLGILFFANILSSRFFVRADLTENKEYTITDSTKKILSNIDDIVNIHLYFSKNLPSYLSNLETQIKDILEEYQAYSKNHLSIRYFDPADDPDMKQKVQRLGIPELQLRVFEKDQAQVRRAYMGISIQYGDKSEVIPMVKSVDNLEYDLTSAILKVTDPEQRIIGWTAPHTRDEGASGFSQIQKMLDKEYMVRNLEPGKLDTVAKNIKALVIDGNQALNERAKYAIDQYIMNGGKTVFLVDGVKLAEGSLNASETTQDALSLLKHYGFDIPSKLVLDASKAQAAFNSGFMRFSLPYPFWPRIRAENFNKNNPTVSQLESMVMPWTSPLLILPGFKDRYNIETLFTTSERSWTVSAPFDLSPQQRFDVNPDDLEKHTLALDVKGKFSSYFDGKPVPPKTQQTGASTEEKAVLESPETEMIIISNTRFINNQFSQMFPENTIFIQNILDSLVIGDKLIGIRSRSVTARDLDFHTTDEQKIESIKKMHRFFGTFGIPILLVVFGLIRLTLKRKRKARLAQQFKS